MRFLSTAGRTDLKKTRALVLSAIERGVNHFDTAYIYKGNEAVLGYALECVNEEVKIANKLPFYL